MISVKQSCKNGMNSRLPMAIMLIKLFVCVHLHSDWSKHPCLYFFCRKSAPCFIDDSDCTALFVLFQLWKSCAIENTSHASISSPASQSLASSLNRQWLYLSPALEWIGKSRIIETSWGMNSQIVFLYNMQLLWNWPENENTCLMFEQLATRPIINTSW